MKKKVILVSALLASLVSSGVMADQAADIQEAKTKAEQALEKANEVEGKVTATDGKVKNIEKDLTTYKGETDALKTKLNEYDTVKTNAANAVQNKTDIIDLKQKVAAAEQKVADVDQKVDTKLEAFRQAGNITKDIANEAKQKADEAKQKADEAKQKAETVEGKFTTLEGKVTTVSDKADLAANKAGDLEQKVTQIDKTVKSHNEEITKIKAGNTEFQEGIAGQLRQAKTETDEKVKTISGKADSAVNKVGVLENKLQDYDQVKEKANKVEALDHKIDNTRTDLEKTIKTVDEKVTKLGDPEARIKEVEKTFGDKLASMEGYTNKGLAKVTALSGLHPLGYDAASKWNISVATGHYKSENAIAMGAFFRPNRHVLLSFAGTVSGGDDAYTFGASIRVGRSGHKEMSGASEGMISATEFYDIVGKLQDEIARQKQEIEALKNR